jgi:hypothetical protein
MIRSAISLLIFAEELAALLIAEDEPELCRADARCGGRGRAAVGEEEFCASFYTVLYRRAGTTTECRLDHSAEVARTNVDVADGRLMHVEVINNPEFRRRLVSRCRKWF